MALVSQLLCLHLSFIENMTVLTQNIMPLELFNQIAKGKAFFTADDLFSFLLNLPVIFSTYDAEIICSCFQLTKETKCVEYPEFRKFIVIGSPQLAEQFSWVETTASRTLAHQTSGMLSKTQIYENTIDERQQAHTQSRHENHSVQIENILGQNQAIDVFRQSVGESKLSARRSGEIKIYD